jgi:succinate dehydrogenase / fumarate reductase, iron-sulfur subunit
VAVADSTELERSQVVSDDRLPVSEFAAEVQGGLSPFGEDMQFPLPADQLLYRHPGADERPHLVVDMPPE